MNRCSLRRRASFVLLSMFTSAVAAAETTIVVNLGSYPSATEAGHSEGKVKWGDADRRDDTVCTECFAAVELQNYLRKISGKPDTYPIVDDDRLPDGDVILIGSPESNAATRKLATALGIDTQEFTTLSDQGYRIKTGVVDGRRVTLIAGRDRVGTLYGTYDYLHHLGCRWFGIGEGNEFVPPAGEPLDVDVTEQPSFTVRGFRARYDIPTPDVDFFLWMARNRLNLWGVEAAGDPAVARKLGIKLAGGGHTAIKLFLNPNSAYPYNHASVAADDDKPQDPYATSGDFRGDANADGMLSTFEAHPEWFSFFEGKRTPGLRRGQWGKNFCTSNRDATSEFVKKHVQALIDGIYQDADMIRLWTLDHGDWCQCPNCKALGENTDRYLKLIYDFDQRIKQAQAEGKINREVLVRFLIYGDVLAPPSRALPDDFDYETCVGTFFPIKRCYLHCFSDASCSRNLPFQQMLYGWSGSPSRHYRGQLCIGEYYNLKRFANLPICFMHSMQADLPHYHQSGARHFHYMHSTIGNWGTRTLTNYQMARQNWDALEPCEALWDDYFAKRYGPVAGTMRSFYESLEQTLDAVAELKQKDGLCVRLELGRKNLFPHPHLRYDRQPGVRCDGTTFVEIMEHSNNCRQLIDQAMAADLPPTIKARLTEDEGLFRYAEQTLAYYDACVQAYRAVFAGDKAAAQNHLNAARRVAKLLRNDTDSTSAKYLSPHVATKNALEATLAVGAIERIKKLIESRD